MVKCLICNNEFDKLSLHLKKSHKMKIDDYYYKFFPKVCLYSGQKIPFHTVEQYLSQIFINRQNMILFLKKGDKEESESIIKTLLQKRKNEKQLIYSPSTIEALCSDFVPSPLLCEQIKIDYNKICQEIGLINRYKYMETISFSKKEKIKVIIDTREQNELKFDNAETIRSTLIVGDYAGAQDFYHNLVIERKSLEDLLGTLSQGFERFCREIERAKELNQQMIVICESEFKDFKNFSEKQWIHSKASFSFISHRLKEIMQKHNHVQFLFVNGRKRMVDVIEKIFSYGDIKGLDLQYFHSKGIL